LRWEPIIVPEECSKPKLKLILRLNALGSLYFFAKHILGRNRLSTFHRSILTRLETDRPRYLLEAPRDHYKTVMVTEARNMWRALPFNEADEAAMRELGYDNAWIRWMQTTHNPTRRSLTISEVLENAVKVGFRIDWHYRENDKFKWVFNEIIPDKDCTWNNETKQHKCAKRGPQGEGTFDYIGVGGALQSRHYSDVYEDDVVGKEALESELVMGKTHDYHKLLIGAFERYSEASWVVVNNRWAPNDLSGWIRTNQPEFFIESHSALGGCCDEHPHGTPIFPEEFSVETLAEIRRVQGPYFFSHQYLNLPVNPEECIFNKDWLRFYSPVESPLKIGRHWLHHDVKAGETVKDLDPNTLVRSMVVDPNHGGSDGRARHAIVVTGFDPETDRIYLLDLWAKSMSYDDLMANIYKIATTWNLGEFWLETIAAQKYLKYHIEYRNKIENRRLTVRELKSEHSKNAKRTRIEALEPLFREGRFWVRNDQAEFLDEYYDYPGGRTVDILDCLGYATQTWNAIHAKRILDMMRQRKERWKGYNGAKPKA
jgi:hypothetical protein